jgi:hypothetical protein
VTNPFLKENKAYHILLMCISPLIGLALIFKMKNKAYITYMGTLFFGFLGSLFIYSPDSHGATHLEAVKLYYVDMSFIEFIDGTIKLLTFRPTEISNDLYLHLISYLSGGVFQIPELIHVFGGLLLGYFFTKSVLLVLEDKPKQKLGILLLSFIALFLIVRSISALNSLRMWTGMWAFFYGAYAYVKKKETRFLWVIVLAIFVHFSYLLFAFPLAAAIQLRKRRKLVVGIFIASFVINVGFQQAFGLVESTGLYQDKLKYTVIDQDEQDRRATQSSKNEGTANFYKEFGPYVYNNFSILLLSFVLIVVYLKKTNIEYLDFLIAGGLLILTLSNLAETTSPSVHGRGYTIAATFLTAAAIQILILKNQLLLSKFKRRLINASFPVFIASSIPFLLFHISYALNSISAFFIVLPFSSWFLGDKDFSVRDFIAQLIF